MTMMNFTIMKALNIKEFNSMIVDDKSYMQSPWMI